MMTVNTVHNKPEEFFDELIQSCKAFCDDEEITAIREAHEFALKAHGNTIAANGQLNIAIFRLG